MAEYKGIKGFKVQYLSADPSDPIIGQTWYNDTSKDLKYTGVTTTSSWATGNNMNTGRHGLAGAGTQSAALGFGGEPPPLAAVSATGEIGPAGTNNSENWNGTSWTSGGNVSTARNQAAGFGTQIAGAIAGGVGTSATEHYDGTTWTGGGSLPSTRYGGAAGGTLTAGIHAVGQLPSSVTNEVLYYDGSTWTAQAGTANVARAGMQSTGAGTQTAFGIYGGSNPYTGSTEFWDGTSFTAASNLSTTRASAHVGKSGTPSAGIMFGGNTPPGAKVADVEEWNGASPATKTITVS